MHGTTLSRALWSVMLQCGEDNSFCPMLHTSWGIEEYMKNPVRRISQNANFNCVYVYSFGRVFGVVPPVIEK